MSTRDITAELGIEPEGPKPTGRLEREQLVAPSADLLAEQDLRDVEVGGNRPQPGSLADLVRLRGRAENYFNWASIFLGVLLLRWFVWYGDGLILFEGVAYLSGGIALWRNRASLVGAGLVAAGALFGVMDRLEMAAQFEMSTALFAMISLEVSLGVRYGMRIHKILTGNGPAADKNDRRNRRADFTIAKPVRKVAAACIVTGVLYLLVTVLLSGMAFELQEFFGILHGDMWFLDLPVVGMEILEDLAIILAGAVFLLARAGWARGVLAALCGVYAMEWWLSALSGYELTLKEICFALFWSFGFAVLASRRRTEEFAEVEGGENAFTIPEQLEVVRRFDEI